MERLARDAPPDDIPWIHLQMRLAFLRGDLAGLRSLSEALVKLQTRANRMENAAFELAWHAGIESYAGNYAEARKLRRQAEQAGNDSALGLMESAQALGEAGDATKAEALAKKLDQMFPEDTFQQNVILPVIRSVSERQRGNAAKAVDLLVPATQYPNVLAFFHLGRAYMAAGEYAKAATDFEKVINHRGWPEWEVFAPLSRLALARSYAMQGDGENSRKAYDDFFITWKNADPDIPILRQAKAEYEKLAATGSAAASASGKTQ
jgi:tetratricopeptide (TPR) repeat protein